MRFVPPISHVDGIHQNDAGKRHGQADRNLERALLRELRRILYEVRMV